MPKTDNMLNLRHIFQKPFYRALYIKFIHRAISAGIQQKLYEYFIQLRVLQHG